MDKHFRGTGCFRCGVWSDHCVSDADAGAGHVTSDNVGEICNLLLQLTDAGDLDMGDLRQVEQSQFPAFRAPLAAAVAGPGWCGSVVLDRWGSMVRGWSWPVVLDRCGPVVRGSSRSWFRLENLSNICQIRQLDLYRELRSATIGLRRLRSREMLRHKVGQFVFQVGQAVGRTGLRGFLALLEAIEFLLEALHTGTQDLAKRRPVLRRLSGRGRRFWQVEPTLNVVLHIEDMAHELASELLPAAGDRGFRLNHSVFDRLQNLDELVDHVLAMNLDSERGDDSHFLLDFREEFLGFY